MPDLTHLGLATGWIYEAIVTTKKGRSNHAAPVGFSTKDQAFCELVIFKSSQTWQNIITTGEMALNITQDLSLFAKALHAKDKLEYIAGQAVSAPVLKGVDCVLELELVESFDQKDRAKLITWPKRIFGELKSPLLNRAHALYLENLIMETRASFANGRELKARILENQRVIAKVAPDSDYHVMGLELLKRLRLA